ncbi:hypothetical protein OEZ85_005130 [Tetradesmus obliquus]|uniref:AAA+ ATPase domain-containing protein n=1 Tax=Tetradesmus obliquus TaxID=3088 RepID=A0ABY8UK65_TETOB|nr:hypothetical protein OEZ85_005130 [Tetradesmus obliquus]
MEDTTGCEQMVNEDETTASQEQRLLSDLTLKRHNSTFVCAGASGAGKTTLINAISKELGNDRWGAPKANSVTRNVNTLRTNKSAVRSITSWLTQMKGINTPIEDMQPLEFVQLVADYVLVHEVAGAGGMMMAPGGAWQPPQQHFNGGRMMQQQQQVVPGAGGMMMAAEAVGGGGGGLRRRRAVLLDDDDE